MKTLESTMTLPADGGKDLDLPISMCTAYDRTFFEVGFQKNQNIYRWVYLLATPEEAKNFSACYTFKHPTNNEKKIQWYTDVQSMFTPKETIFEDEPVIRYRTAKCYANEKFEVEYSVKIRNMKEESKDDFEESGISDNDN